MLSAIDARARSQIAAAYAALFLVGVELADPWQPTPPTRARRRITDPGAMAAESAEQAMALSRQKARVECRRGAPAGRRRPAWHARRPRMKTPAAGRC